MIAAENRLRRALRAGRRRLSSPRGNWRRALPSELEFWSEYVRTGGLDFPDDYRQRVNPDAPIEDPLLLGAIDQVGGSVVRIIDVGAGPLSSVGKRDPRAPERRIELVAVDPLADEYAELLEAAAVRAPVATRACRGEDVAREFGAGRFDIAYARNSLDHGVDPMAAIESMLAAVRVGGVVLLHHYRCEAEVHGYEQLHQWNFDVRDGRLRLFGRHEDHDVGARLAGRARTSAFVHDGSYHAQWIAATITRIS